MGGTLSAEEAALALRLFFLPPSSDSSKSMAAFEQAFGAAVGAAHAVSFGTGRAALWAILRALGIGSGDEVIVPGYTCVAVPNAVRFAGARPVYADIDPLTFNVNERTCARVVSPRTRALVVAHTYGLPAPMEELRALARARGLSLIEDAAHALGSTYQGRPVGSLGDAAFFSTEHSKTISTGLGGIATTTDTVLAAALRSIHATFPAPCPARVRRVLLPHLIFSSCYRTRRRRLGEWLLFRSRLYERAEWSTRDNEHRGEQPPGYLWQMSIAQARLGLEQLRRLPELNASRTRIAKYYSRRLRERGLQSPMVAGSDCTIYVRFPYLSRCRDALLVAAAAHRLELGLWFEAPVHPQQANLAAVGYTEGECPVAEETSRTIVNLPCHPGVTEADAARYVELLGSVEG